MTTREELQERYEDALFALFMHDIGAVQEKEAEEENQRLNSTPDFAVGEDADRRCMQVIRRYRTGQRVRAAGRVTLKVLRHVAMAAGIAAFLFVGVLAASETARVNTANLIVNLYKTHLDISYTYSDPERPVPPEFSVGWVPEGLSLLEEETDGFFSRWYTYLGPTTERLTADCQRTEGMAASFDVENATIEDIEIQGEQAMLIDKHLDDRTLYQVVWTSRDGTLLLSVMGEDISRDDVIRVAEELKY